MSHQLETAWQAADLVVLRDGHEIDRIPTSDIERVILVCRRGGDSPGDLGFAVIETHDDHVLLPAESGIAGRIHFERQAFWASKACIYWPTNPRRRCRAACARACGCCVAGSPATRACRSRSWLR
jgi:hypothetical protein